MLEIVSGVHGEFTEERDDERGSVMIPPSKNKTADLCRVLHPPAPSVHGRLLLSFGIGHFVQVLDDDVVKLRLHKRKGGLKVLLWHYGAV